MKNATLFLLLGLTLFAIASVPASAQIIVCTQMGSLGACLGCCDSQYDYCVPNTCGGMPECGFCSRRQTACYSACDTRFGFSPTKPAPTSDTVEALFQPSTRVCR